MSSGGLPPAALILYTVVNSVLERAGYTRTDFNSSDSWSLLWAHDYPFKKLRERMLGLRPGQRVNKFPGSGYITNKVEP